MKEMKPNSKQNYLHSQSEERRLMLSWPNFFLFVWVDSIQHVSVMATPERHPYENQDALYLCTLIQ